MSKELRVFLASDICAMLSVSKTHAYKIIRQLNQELEEQGYITTPGRVPKAYFEERCYLAKAVDTANKEAVLS